MVQSQSLLHDDDSEEEIAELSESISTKGDRDSCIASFFRPFDPLVDDRSKVKPMAAAVAEAMLEKLFFIIRDGADMMCGSTADLTTSDEFSLFLCNCPSTASSVSGC
jgi:hypothetical protein